jgi:sugar phosphate isomerase/epimerase
LPGFIFSSGDSIGFFQNVSHSPFITKSVDPSSGSTLFSIAEKIRQLSESDWAINRFRRPNMPTSLSRRRFIAAAAATGGLAACAGAARAASPAPAEPGGAFRFALNTATLRGYKLPLADQIKLAAEAGYAGIEPWLADIAKADEGGTLGDLRKQCADAGLAVVSAIGFAVWAVDDGDARAKGLEQMKRDMDLVARLGGARIAAPPMGVHQAGAPALDLDHAAERYRAVLELGRAMGVVPQLEFWGASANLSRLDQCLYVAARAAHPDACVLADAFHLYRGGSEPATLRLLGRSAAHVFHMNDYPAQPPREAIKDSDRVWPGDGIAPLAEILDAFRANRADIWLSVEVFNAAYWQRPAPDTARAGLAKMKAVAAAR